MRIKKGYLLLGLLLVPSFCFAQTASKPLERIFYLPAYNAEAGVASLNLHYQEIDIVAPQMHTVDSNFDVVGGFGPKLKQAIAAHNLKVMPLISNANFSQILMHNLLTSDDGQTKVINQLIALAQRQKYIGWQFDFEHMSYQDKDLYTAFVKKAYQLFQKNNLELSVIVAAKSSDAYQDTDAYKNWDGAYDYKSLAENCDFISIMAYDDPNSQGPAASISFVNTMLVYAESQIPADKISLGIPLYYWKWNETTATKVGSGFFSNILAIEDLYRYTTGFDATLGVAWLDYFFKNQEYKVWFEDKQSFQEKFQIAETNNLRGFSAWLLGGEDPGIWNFLATQQQITK